MADAESVKVSVFIATSLDGFIARPDGDVSWLHEVEPLADGDDAGYGAFFNTVDALVMGRGSFEKVLEFDPWPYGSKPVIVMSATLKEIPERLRETVSIETLSPRALLDRLAQIGYRHIYLDGGRVIQSFLREGLVDEMTLTTIPVLIGDGRPLFGALDHDLCLRLLESRSFENGMTQSKYQVHG